MNNMEFTWRMLGTLIWPVVALAALIAYRPWITKNLGSLRVKAGGFEGEVRVLNDKVDTIGRDVGATLSEIPQPPAEGEIPTSLVDLIPMVTWNRREGLRTAFGLVLKALRDSYPQLRRYPPSQLLEAAQGLVDRGELGADVSASVRQLQELLEMPEWNVDQVGDTRGYAFLMLAEGAIHEILRTAQHYVTDTDSSPSGNAVTPVRPSWHGTYDDRFLLELRILNWDGLNFTGVMRYPSDDTVTRVSGQTDRKPGSASVSLSWRELGYEQKGQRTIDFSGEYVGTVTGDHMDADWRRGRQPIVQFTMTAAAGL